MLGRGRDPLGPEGERCAEAFLKAAGYRVLGRNVRVRIGEADLICESPDREAIVVVEVKARRMKPGRDRAAVPPERSVTRAKRRRLVAVANWLARANDWTSRTVRIDVVAIEWPMAGGEPTIRHYRGV
ncbi:MAG: YraN family protein [Phycisphaerae bacterium]|nr:YraN family protein [Phycisphaerae bacterium]